MHALFHQLVNGRCYNVLFFSAQQSTVAAFGVKREQGNARSGDTKVAHKAVIERLDTLFQALLGYTFCNLFKRQIAGGQRHTHVLVDHNRQPLSV